MPQPDREEAFPMLAEPGTRAIVLDVATIPMIDVTTAVQSLRQTRDGLGARGVRLPIKTNTY